MARKQHRKALKRRGSKSVTVKGHSRSPRGPNVGKRAVHVRRYKRRPPAK